MLAYVLALAPVLLAGRPSFSSYMALSDSAVHMIGADFLIHHGQDYAHLDLRNSYGQFINDYYNTSYPSGADTLFGGSALLLGLPLIWAFQPFNAFMLAIAAGPAWLLARAMRLDRPWAALAALTAVLPALVYAYELIGSVKEITALAMILTLGCAGRPAPRLAARTARAPAARSRSRSCSPRASRRSAWRSARGRWRRWWCSRSCSPPTSAHGRASAGAALALVGVAALALLIAAWPTWVDLSGSLRVAQSIAATGNPGNLHTPLHAVQVLGVWLRGSYKLPPSGAALAVDGCADRDRDRLGAAGRGPARAHARVRARRLVRADAAGVAGGRRDGHHVGGSQDAHADLARWSCCSRGEGWRRSRPSNPCRGERSGRRRRRCSRSRSSAACSPRTRCSTTAPTSRRRRATRSWPR